MVSFAGAVASKKVSEAFKGMFILVGNQWKIELQQNVIVKHALLKDW